MGVASVSEYVASLNEEQRRHVSAFIDFMGAEYPQLTPKISFSMPMWRENGASISNTAMKCPSMRWKKASTIS